MYLLFTPGAADTPTWILLELLGVVVYGGIAALGLRGSAWWLVAGWALHPLWDVVLHYLGPGHPFAPASYTIPCLTFDLAVAAIAAWRFSTARWRVQMSLAERLA